MPAGAQAARHRYDRAVNTGLTMSYSAKLAAGRCSIFIVVPPGGRGAVPDARSAAASTEFMISSLY